jgi:hypothetical protein
MVGKSFGVEHPCWVRVAQHVEPSISHFFLSPRSASTRRQGSPSCFFLISLSLGTSNRCPENLLGQSLSGQIHEEKELDLLYLALVTSAVLWRTQSSASRCKALAHFRSIRLPHRTHGSRSLNLIPAYQYSIWYCLAFSISAFPPLSLKSRSPNPRADLAGHLVAHELGMPRNGTRLPPSSPLCNVCSGFHLNKDDRSVDREDAFNPGLVVNIKWRG